MKAATSLFLAIVFASSAGAYEPTAEQAAIAAHFRSSVTIVLDAAWTAEDIFRVGVIDNGADRSALAYEVCKYLKSKGLRKVTVDVIDIMVLKYQSEWKSLGRRYGYSGCD